MIEFGYILIIIFEVILASLIVAGLIYLENKVQNCLTAVNIEADNVLTALKNVRQNLERFNGRFNKIKKLNIKKIKKILSLTLDIIELTLLIRQAGFKKIFFKKLFRKFV